MADLRNGVIGWHLRPSLGCLWALQFVGILFHVFGVFEARHLRHEADSGQERSALAAKAAKLLRSLTQDAASATNMDETGSVSSCGEHLTRGLGSAWHQSG